MNKSKNWFLERSTKLNQEEKRGYTSQMSTMKRGTIAADSMDVKKDNTNFMLKNISCSQAKSEPTDKAGHSQDASETQVE